MRIQNCFHLVAVSAAILIALPPLRAADFVLTPTDDGSAKSYSQLKSGQSVTIDGRSYKLVDLAELTALTRKRYEHVVVPKLEIDSLSLAEVLAFLQSRFTDLTLMGNDGEPGNYPFIKLTADPEIANSKVTIHARNILLKDALNNIAKQAGCASIEIRGSEVHLSLKAARASVPVN